MDSAEIKMIDRTARAGQEAVEASVQVWSAIPTNPAGKIVGPTRAPDRERKAGQPGVSANAST